MTTDREFRDFEFWIDYKTVAQADSGIYLKATRRSRSGTIPRRAANGASGLTRDPAVLWNNSPHSIRARIRWSWPTNRSASGIGLRILQLGARTTVYLNDKLVVNHATLENFWDRSSPLFPQGPIQLQTHGGEIRWRNIFVREIPADGANAILGETRRRRLCGGVQRPGLHWLGRAGGEL